MTKIIIKYDDGSKYDGFVKDGVPNGEGTYYPREKYNPSYTGTWKNGISKVINIAQLTYRMEYAIMRDDNTYYGYFVYGVKEGLFKIVPYRDPIIEVMYKGDVRVGREKWCDEKGNALMYKEDYCVFANGVIKIYADFDGIHCYELIKKEELECVRIGRIRIKSGIERNMCRYLRRTDSRGNTTSIGRDIYHDGKVIITRTDESYTSTERTIVYDQTGVIDHKLYEVEIFTKY